MPVPFFIFFSQLVHFVKNVWQRAPLLQGEGATKCVECRLGLPTGEGNGKQSCNKWRKMHKGGPRHCEKNGFKKVIQGGGVCVVQGLAHFRSVQLLLVNLVWRSYVVYKKNVVATQRDFNGCLEASPWPPPPSSFHHDPGHPLPASFQIKWVCAGSNSEAQQNREKSGAADAAHWSFLLRFLFSPLALSSCGLGHSSCDCLHVSGLSFCCFCTARKPWFKASYIKIAMLIKQCY